MPGEALGLWGVPLAVLGGAQVAERNIANFPSMEKLVWPAVILLGASAGGVEALTHPGLRG